MHIRSGLSERADGICRRDRKPAETARDGTLSDANVCLRKSDPSIGKRLPHHPIPVAPGATDEWRNIATDESYADGTHTSIWPFQPARPIVLASESGLARRSQPDWPGSAAPVRRALSFICLLVAGCSLPATMLPTPGRLPNEDVGGGLLRIAVPTGGLADCASADECVLVRAAEATQRAGGTHFMVLPGHGGPTQRGYAYIKVFTLGPGEGVPSSTMSAEEALTFFRKRPGQVAS